MDEKHDCKRSFKETHKPKRFVDFVEKVMEDVSVPSLDKKELCSFTRVCGNPFDVLREKGLLRVVPDYQGKMKDRSQNGECPEVDLAFYTEQGGSGERIKLFSSNHKFKNGRLVYACTQEVLPEFSKELERFNNWWNVHFIGDQNEDESNGKIMSDVFEELIKNAMAERQKYATISGNNDKEQNKERTTPRNSRMSIKLCAEDHECKEQKVLKWLKDYVHRHDGRCSKTSVKPEFCKEDDNTFEDEKVTSWVWEIKDYVQRRDRGEDVAPEQLLKFLKQTEESETHPKTCDAKNKPFDIKDFKTKNNFYSDAINDFSSHGKKSSNIKEAKMQLDSRNVLQAKMPLDSKNVLQKNHFTTANFHPRDILPFERSSLECFAKCHKRNGSYDEVIITKGSCMKNEHLADYGSSALNAIENYINKEALENYREKYGKRSSEEEIKFHAREDFIKEIENCQKYPPI